MIRVFHDSCSSLRSVTGGMAKFFSDVLFEADSFFEYLNMVK